MKELNSLAQEVGSFLPEKKPEIYPVPKQGDDPIVEKIKKWLLIGLTVLVVSGAVALIIKSLINKLF